MFKQLFAGFKKFIMRGNAIDLAVGVVIGAAFNSLIQALVKDLVTPIIGIIGQTPDFSGIFFTINKSRFFIGDLISAIISFLLVAIAVYFFVVMPMNYLASMEKKEESPTTKKCPECLSEIPIGATRCAHCSTKIG